MRTRILLAGLLAMALAGCSSGATIAPSPEPSSAPETAPPSVAAPTATPEPIPEALDVKVTFDGETCTYLGPSVVPDGTVMRFEYAPNQEWIGTYLIVYGVEPGTSWEELKATEGGKVTDPPDFVYEATAAWVHSNGSMLYTISSTLPNASNDGVYEVGGYGVGCDTPTNYPVDPDVIWHAALLTVAES